MIATLATIFFNKKTLIRNATHHIHFSFKDIKKTTFLLLFGHLYIDGFHIQHAILNIPLPSPKTIIK
jgi:hypothetical protein